MLGMNEPFASAMPRPSSDLLIEQGACYVLFAHDVGFSIDLDEAERRISTGVHREVIRHQRRGPRILQFTPSPLRISQTGESIALGDFRTAGAIEAVMYDFGAVSIAYKIPLRGTLNDLLALSECLYENPRLLADARRRAEALVETTRPAISKPHIPAFVEDYAIYQIESLSRGAMPGPLASAHARTIAQILRSERRPLSEQEVADAMACRLSYSDDDLTLIDWNAAVVFDQEPEDIRVVLEFANVELLEMRVLDHQLDRALTEAYETISRRAWRRPALPRSAPSNLRRVSQLEVDNAVLFEGVNNALKLIGDQYLARVYRLASQRFHLNDWDAGILRKLATLEGIYQKLADERSHLRMEILEWIIIILIALSIVMPLVGLGGH